MLNFFLVISNIKGGLDGCLDAGGLENVVPVLGDKEGVGPPPQQDLRRLQSVLLQEARPLLDTGHLTSLSKILATWPASPRY